MTTLFNDTVLRSGDTYPLDEFLRRTGWKRHAYRMAKRTGLKVITAGGRVFVRGCDFDRYLDRLAGEQDAATN